MLPSQAEVSSYRIHSSVIMMSIPELALFIPLFIPEADCSLNYCLHRHLLIRRNDDTLLLIFSRVCKCKSLSLLYSPPGHHLVLRPLHDRVRHRLTGLVHTQSPPPKKIMMCWQRLYVSLMLCLLEPSYK